MALRRNLTNPTTEQEVNAYCVIPRFDEFDNDRKYARFTLWFYARECTKVERLGAVIQPFGSQSFCAEGDVFDEYFADSVFSETDATPLGQAYACATESSIVEGVETNPWATAADC